jgi:hypothetical protein
MAPDHSKSRMSQLELDGLIKETQELARILVSSIRTASRNDK